VTDNGVPVLGAERTFVVTVAAGNHAPRLSLVGDQATAPGKTLTLTLTATDPEVPPQRLTYSLDSQVPAGTRLDPATGVFTWEVPSIQASGSYPFTVRVTDDGVPPLSDRVTFNVFVSDDPTPAGFRLTNVAVSDTGFITFRWQSVPAKTYRVLFKFTLADAEWNLLNSVTATGAESSYSDSPAPGTQQRYYQIQQMD
jgi:hypothetical protein